MSDEVNRENKDRLFKFIFGREENKEWTLSLYNAVNGSSYTNPDDIVINTIEEVMYLGMKNDVSFIISETMNIYEQQSSFNPNMPLRQFIYSGKLYSKYIEREKINIYGSTLKKIPVPKLICFYNGPDERPEKEILTLSDAFDGEADISVRVTMININYGKNEKLLAACQALREYSWIIEEIRKNRKEYDLDPAIEKSIRKLQDDSLLKPFLMGHLAEVKSMCLREYSEEEIKEMFREEYREIGREEGRKEGREEGRKEGRKEGQASALMSLVNDNIITLSQAVERSGMTEAELLAAVKKE